MYEISDAVHWMVKIPIGSPIYVLYIPPSHEYIFPIVNRQADHASRPDPKERAYEEHHHADRNSYVQRFLP